MGGGIAGASGDPTLGESGVRFFLEPARHDRGAALIGIDSLSSASGATVSNLDQLASQGQFMRPLSPERRYVVSGVFAGKVQRGGAAPTPLDQRTSFARREGRVFVFVQLNPQEKRDASSSYEVYDADYKTLVRSQPTPLKLKKNELLFSTWSFAIDRLAQGTYRVDLLLGQGPVWRGWVRVTD